MHGNLTIGGNCCKHLPLPNHITSQLLTIPEMLALPTRCYGYPLGRILNWRSIEACKLVETYFLFAQVVFGCILTQKSVRDDLRIALATACWRGAGAQL